MNKWKCHNCGNVFETDSDPYDDFVEHIYNCINCDDFYQELEKQE